MHHNDYTVGWICALSAEMTAARSMLDSEHDLLQARPHDDNDYALGSIGEHNVVITCLPVTGTNSAAIVATRMLSTFTSIRFSLMVGIGGGVPNPSTDDVRLGDVVVSKPGKNSGGVVQYDFGKTLQGNRFVHTGTLNRPPDVLLAAVNGLKASHGLRPPQLPKYLSEGISEYSREEKNFKYQGAENDVLFAAEYDHQDKNATDCSSCDKGMLVTRERRSRTDPKIHYGVIASGNQVIRDGLTRERLREEFDILCVEMEAAGLMDSFPCLVIRGICDYADSHKNKRWQEYAASTAAAYAKELLSAIPSRQVIKTERITQEIKNSNDGYQPEQAKPLTLEPTPADSRATKLLSENGFDITQSAMKMDALLWAAKNGHVAAVHLLLDKGANANAKDQKRGGMTPLHLAALGGHEEVVGLLLEKGADPTVRSVKGDTPEKMARSLGKTAIVDLLQIAIKSQYS